MRLPTSPGLGAWLDSDTADLPLPAPVADDANRYSRLCTDPDLNGDATLFAVCLQTFITQLRELGPTERRVYTRRWWWHVGCMARPGWEPRLVRFWVQRVITNDLPRYVPEDDGAAVDDMRCEAPMLRREGMCGKHPTIHVEDRDPLTGEGRSAHFCTRHKAHAEPLRARWNEWRRNGQPEPEPNAGGVLPRYFATDWPQLYKWACAREPADGAKPPTLPPPMLKIVRDDS
jgi:hypothetical protein